MKPSPLSALLLLVTLPAAAQVPPGFPPGSAGPVPGGMVLPGTALPPGWPGLPGSAMPGLPGVMALPPGTVLLPVLPQAAASQAVPAPAAVSPPVSVPPPLPDGPVAKIPIGTVASARLTMTAVSDYPGPWRAALDQPIYSIDRRHVLFPAGSVVVGRTVQVTGANQAINNRLGFLPTHLVRPDGEAFPLRRQAVLDQLGIAGIADQVDYHLGTQLAAIGAFGAVEALPEILRDQLGGESDAALTIVDLSAAQGQVLLSRYLTLLPTVTIRAGTPLRIFFQEEMIVPLLGPTDRFQLSNMAPDPPAPPPPAQSRR